MNAHSCGECGGGGMMVVPHLRCVLHGQLVPYRFLNGSNYGRIVTTAVICDFCQAGRDIVASQNNTVCDGTDKKKMMTYSLYLERLQGVDGATMLREYQRKQASESRRVMPRTEGENQLFDALLSRIVATQEQQAA